MYQHLSKKEKKKEVETYLVFGCRRVEKAKKIRWPGFNINSYPKKRNINVLYLSYLTGYVGQIWPKYPVNQIVLTGERLG